ncbi:DUF6344 domain-containing protein [Streptomyces sp. MRC013]|uniref:DUF6344 domain-containing protein n=1 Tax=Streptomyces sp. MRC013 TaxID=2898276 RepID=UPI002025C503|nr:DUF6344 domain-containing protein [Streptomyces sp. MRC013]URM90674.1 DUF6344 domain-containing protein [Streptomyces sp. MRC013]
MAADRVTHFWTAIVSFLRGLLALAGLTPPVAHRCGGAAAPAAPAARTSRTAAAALPVQRPAAAPGAGAGRGVGYGVGGGRTPRGWALPPTIKQRIRAEAHGASPAVRRLPAADVPAPVCPADAGHTAAAALVGAAAAH